MKIYFGFIVCIFFAFSCKSVKSQSIEEEALKIYKSGKRKLGEGKLKEAKIDLEKARLLFIQTENKRQVALCLFHQGGIAIRYNTYEKKREARVLFIEAIPLFKEINSNTKLLESYYYLGYINYQLGEIKEAQSAFQLSAKYGLKIKNLNSKYLYRISATYRLTGTLYGRINQADSSIHYTKKALDIITNLPKEDQKPLHFAELHQNIGAIQIDFNRFSDAKLSFLKVETFAKNDSTNDGLMTLGKSYLAMSYIFRKKEDKVNELKYLDIAETLYLENNLNKELPALYNNYANHYLHYRDTASALDFYHKGISYFEKGKINHNDKITIYNNLGTVYFALGQTTKGEEYYQKSLGLQKEYYASTPKLADAYNSIADTYFNQGQSEKALELIQEAFIVNTENFTSETINDSPNSRTIIKNDLIFLASLSLKAKILASYNFKNTQAQLQALSIIETADTLLNQLILEYTLGDDKLQLIEIYHDLYPLGTQMSYDLYKNTGNEDYLKQAFYFSERSKTFILQSDVSLRMNLYKQGLQDNEINIYEYQKAEVQSLISQLTIYKDKLSDKIKTDYLNQIDILNKQINQFRRDYILNNKDNSWTDISTVSKLQSRLTEKEVIASYLVLEKNILAFVISKQHFTAHLIKKDNALTSNLDDFINSYRERYPRKFAKKAHQLYQDLVQPLARDLEGKSKIIFIPHNELLDVSFEALVVEEQAKNSYRALKYLINDFDISYHYSASLWLSNKFTKDNFENFYLGIAAFSETSSSITIKDKQYSLNELPFSKSELINAQEIYQKNTKKTDIHFDKNAYIGYPSTNILRANIIQYSTHSIYKDGIVYFVLQNKNGNLITFTKDNLYQYPSLKCELLLFNSCSSAKGEFIEGEGIISITRPALYNGIPNIVVSMNDIPDKSSAELLTIFHQNVAKGISYSASLNNAKRAMIEKNMMPYRWARHIFIGSD
jgi:CHAT domain-containing protein